MLNPDRVVYENEKITICAEKFGTIRINYGDKKSFQISIYTSGNDSVGRVDVFPPGDGVVETHEGTNGAVVLILKKSK